MSKSGLFAHFGSREELLLAVLDRGQQEFLKLVVNPALAKPRGLPRLQRPLRRLARLDRVGRPARRLPDDRRRHRVRRQARRRCATRSRRASAPGSTRSRAPRARRSSRASSRPDTDPEQISFELFGIALVVHHHRRLLGYEKARARALAAFDALIERHAAPSRNRACARLPANPKGVRHAPRPPNCTELARTFAFPYRSRCCCPSTRRRSAERLFLTPPKPTLSAEHVLRLPRRARELSSSYRGRQPRHLALGPARAPAVLLAHGWGGHAAQMRGFVPHLAAAGLPRRRLRPAGARPVGRQAHRPAGFRRRAGGGRAQHHGNVQHVIAHSLGGPAAAHRARRAACR